MNPRVVLICIDSVFEDSKKILDSYINDFHDKDDLVIVSTIFSIDKTDLPDIQIADDNDPEIKSLRIIVDASRKHALQNLDQAKSLLVKGGISESKIDTCLKQCSWETAETICAVTDQIQPDLVIMGKHNLSAIYRILKTSVSSYVRHHMKKPIILINI